MAQSDRKTQFVFVSTLVGPWGGSEELWSRAALDLVSRGFSVSASMPELPSHHPRILELRARGVDLWLRPGSYSLGIIPGAE